MDNNESITTRRIDMETTSFPCKIFQWRSNHLAMQNYVNSILKVIKGKKDDREQPDFPEVSLKSKKGNDTLTKKNHKNI
jgi:hypothetical protein